jgi:hypothetical protein
VKVKLFGLTLRVVGAAASVSVTFTVRVRPPPLMVSVPVFVPTAAEVVSTATARVPLFEPLAGLTVSQLTASVALHDTFELTDSDWPVGFAAPCVPVKVKLDEPTVNVAVGALRVSVTFTVRVTPPPVTVSVPVFVPTAAEVVSTATASMPLFEPLAGLTVSQLTASVTLHDTFEVIPNDWAAGFAAPCVPVKVKLEEPIVNVGAAAVTVNETGTACGEFVAPVPLTVIEVVYVPGESPVTLAVAESIPGPVPDAGASESQEAVLVAFQLSVPVPELVILTVWAEGLLPP